MQQSAQGEFDSQAFEEEMIEEGEEPTLISKSVSEQSSKHEEVSFYLSRMYFSLNKECSTMRESSVWISGPASLIRRMQLKIQMRRTKAILSQGQKVCALGQG